MHYYPRWLSFRVQLGVCLLVSSVLVGEEPKFTRHHGSPLRNFAISQDGAWLASYGVDRRLRVWSTGTSIQPEELNLEYQGHRKRRSPPLTTRSQLKFSPDAEWLVMVDDATLTVWKIEQKEDKIQSIQERAMQRAPRDFWLPTCLAFSDDGQYFVYGENKSLLFTVHVPAPSTVRLTKLSDAEGTDSLFGRFKYLDFPEMRQLHRDILSIDISGDGKLLAVGGATRRNGMSGNTVVFLGHLHIFELATGRTIVRNEAHEGHVTSLGFSPDRQLLAIAVAELGFIPDTPGAILASSTIDFLNIETRERAFSIGVGEGPVRGITFSPVNDNIFMAIVNGDVQVWNTTSQTQIGRLVANGRAVSMSIAREAELLAVGYADGNIIAWHLQSLPIQ